nr:unnamed protein product [Callosobruchus analis]
MENSSEAEVMWHTLYVIAMKQQNLTLAERCSNALGDVAAAHFLRETLQDAQKFMEKYNENPNNSPDVWAKLSILYGELATAENIYLEQGNIDGALEMYKKLHKWDEAIRLAEQRSHDKLVELKQERMTVLLQTGQFDKIGQTLEGEGKYEEALNMYIKSNTLLRIPKLIEKEPRLLENQSVIANVLKKLVKQELYEAAAEIYDKLGEQDIALECYKKGK